MTTGSHQLQAYWFETGFTRTTGLFPFTWQIQEQRWISRRSAFVMPPSDPIDASPGTWTFICLKCHATHARPRVEFEGNTLTRSDTHVAEFGIACESCHGPAANHVEANQSPTRRYAQSLSSEPDPTIVNPAHLAPLRSTEVCGQCHGVFDYFVDERHMRTWFRDGFVYRPGGELGKYRTAKLTGEEQFWPDGLVRTAGREYNAMLGSACHDRGHMTCLSCHVLHQPVGDTRPHRVWADDQLRDLDGDQTCLQCHAKYGADIAAHSHHAAASEGSRCQNCHMPHTTYGLMKGVRTHRIASPTVQSTLATGRPNACNQCHLDQTLAWTATWLHAWYGTEQPTLSTDDRQIAASVRWILAGDAAQRALMAWSLGWAPARAASGSVLDGAVSGRVARRSVRSRAPHRGTLAAHVAGLRRVPPRLDRPGRSPPRRESSRALDLAAAGARDRQRPPAGPVRARWQPTRRRVRAVAARPQSPARALVRVASATSWT
jgi:hypothetical protein